MRWTTCKTSLFSAGLMRRISSLFSIVNPPGENSLDLGIGMGTAGHTEALDDWTRRRHQRQARFSIYSPTNVDAVDAIPQVRKSPWVPMPYVVVPMSVSLPFGWLRSPQHLNCRPLPPD